MRLRNEKTDTCVGQRILGAIDLAIDFATLGEYGLEQLPTNPPVNGPCRERPGRARRLETPRATGWEAFATARRGGCVQVERSGNGRVRRLHEFG
jgi:hypothetical protein